MLRFDFLLEMLDWKGVGTEFPTVEPSVLGKDWERSWRIAGMQAQMMPTCTSIVDQYPTDK